MKFCIVRLFFEETVEVCKFIFLLRYDVANQTEEMLVTLRWIKLIKTKLIEF